MKIVWSASAEEDLANIVDYIAKDNINAALRIDELLRSAASNLCFYPLKGKQGRVLGTRELVVHPNYILIYTQSNNNINIINILHTSQQYPPE